MTLKTLVNLLPGKAPAGASRDALIEVYLAAIHAPSAAASPPPDEPEAAAPAPGRRASPPPDAGEDAPAAAKRPRRAAAAAEPAPAPAAPVTPAAAKRGRKPAAGRAGAGAEASAGCVSAGEVVEVGGCRFEVGEVLAPGADSTVYRGRFARPRPRDIMSRAHGSSAAPALARGVRKYRPRADFRPSEARTSLAQIIPLAY